MSVHIFAFLKFGSFENILDLYENGTIYMNPIEYFRKTEDGKLRGDEYEGATRVINSLPGTFRIPNVDKDFQYKKIHIKESFETILGNIYSLYAISSHGFTNPNDFKIDERNKSFGTHGLLIKDVNYFIKSIEKKLLEGKNEFYHGLVEYYDKTSICKNDITLFEKPNEFEYQNEFRFLVYNNKVEPIKFQIGSLHNVAEIHEMNVITKIELKLKNSKVNNL